jgi:hypothetical protein
LLKLAVFSPTGVCQIGLVQARSWIVAGTVSDGGRGPIPFDAR